MTGAGKAGLPHSNCVRRFSHSTERVSSKAAHSWALPPRFRYCFWSTKTCHHVVPLTHLNLSLLSNDGSDSGGDVSCGYAMALDRVSLASMSRGSTRPRLGREVGGCGSAAREFRGSTSVAHNSAHF